jgi:hypothetical protein
MLLVIIVTLPCTQMFLRVCEVSDPCLTVSLIRDPDGVGFCVDGADVIHNGSTVCKVQKVNF